MPTAALGTGYRRGLELPWRGVGWINSAVPAGFSVAVQANLAVLYCIERCLVVREKKRGKILKIIRTIYYKQLLI